ncbi:MULTISPECIES: hypothetical protein [Halorubrum]|uniref:hypothetical protein n=1 Tax=Halorubrum TaxID=56688 RepID=UPI0010F58392|nr:MULTISPECIES: hypothetical protein [Halorubrum]TKX39639.1 hypothetical protein EXE52_09950 [Halorubrum sp. CGM4_25_10-8A]TKX64152.1 hypothetical protein EXE47_12265 [Halorubrum sp. GN12_10-3_MGM]
MIKPGPNPSSEIASRVDSWLKDNYESYPSGIHEYQTNEAGFEIELDHDFDSELFTEIVNEVVYLEAEELDDGSIAVQEVEEIGDGLLHRHSIGVTFGPDNIISLGGYDEPIMPSGEPSDTAVEETLELLLLYLSHQS